VIATLMDLFAPAPASDETVLWPEEAMA